MKFQFKTAGQILFGPGVWKDIPQLGKSFGSRLFLLTGKNPDRASDLIHSLRKEGITSFIFSIPGEPTIDLVQKATEYARANNCQWVAGLGGGSVIDAGKAVAALLDNPGEPLDYLEVIGKGKLIENPSVPFIAIPTTAGTGSEVTKNAVLKSEIHHVKVSMRSPYMIPTAAVVDPELMLSMPPEVTAHTGLDALTQLVEPYVSRKSNPLTDGICCEGMAHVSQSLIPAFKDGQNLKAREGMAIAGLFGGLALANAGLGAVHGIAGPLGGMFDAPHGAVCAALLPHAMSVNFRAINARNPQSPIMNKYNRIGQILTQDAKANAEDGIEWIQTICKTLNIPSLSGFGVSPEDVSILVQKSKKASSMMGNPILLEDDEIAEIIMLAL